METKKMCKCCDKYELDSNSLFQICPICGWESDQLQENDPNYSSGANEKSLKEYKKEYSVLDDSFDGLDERITKRIINELSEMSYDELLESAKKDGIENAENFTKEELLKKIEELLNEE